MEISQKQMIVNFSCKRRWIKMVLYYIITTALAIVSPLTMSGSMLFACDSR